MGLVVINVKGSTGVVINRAEKAVSRGGVSTDKSMLATKEAGLVIVTEEADSIINVGEHSW